MPTTTRPYDVSTDLRNFEKLQHTRQRTLNHLNFLLECRRRKIIPGFLTLKCSTSSHRIDAAITRSKFAILRSIIQDTRSKLSKIEKNLYPLHLKISSQLHPITWQIVHSRCMTKTFYEGLKHQEIQRSKLDKLIQAQKPKPVNQNLQLNNPVVNLSSKTFTDSQLQVLSLGLNFSIATKVDVRQAIINTECALKKTSDSTVPSTETDSARASIQKCLTNPPNPKPNLSREEFADLKSLSQDPDLLITKADKGGQIAIINKSDYNSEVTKLLNEQSYQASTKDITNRTLKDVKSAVKSSVYLNSFEKSIAVPSSANPARLYALPKVHKEDVSYRPIVSGIGTATYKLASILAKKLSFLTTDNTHTVKNSEEFIEKMKNLKTSSSTLLVSFDVKSLFTKVPLNEALDCLRRRLEEHSTNPVLIEDILNLVTICTTNTQFQFQGKLFLQTEGLAMGNPLSPLLADIYMHYFESNMLLNATKKPDTWLRYVDDVYSLWNHSLEDLNTFLIYLNSLNPSIQFTFEFDTDSLPFLDVKVMKTSDSLIFTVYRKPFAVNLPIHRRSAHPWSQKMSAFYSFTRRALTICSNKSLLETEINYLKSLAISRGYNSSIIDKALQKFKRIFQQQDRPDTTLQSNQLNKQSNKKYAKMIFYPGISQSIASSIRKCNLTPAFCPSKTIANCLKPLKDSVPDANKWGIYKISCECGQAYIGQTRRKLIIRAKEHARHTVKKNIDQSAIALHSSDTGHKFDFENAKILYTPDYYSQLDISETVYIRSQLKNLVNSNIMPYLHHTWDKILTRQ